jgi:hypothetical protein
MRNAGRCPQCGEPVTPFAAGCAICGADLEEHHQAVAARAARPGIPTVRLPAVDEDVGMLLIVTALVLLFPVVGLVVAILGIRDPRRAGVRTLLIGLAVVAGALLVAPALRYGVLSLVA